MTAQRSKTLLLWAMAATSVVFGAAAQYFQPAEPFGSIGLGDAFVGIVLLFWWYRLDAEQRGYRRSSALNFAVVAFAILGLPYCFFRSRGWRAGAMATLLFFLAVIGWSLLDWLGAILMYFLVQR